MISLLCSVEVPLDRGRTNDATVQAMCKAVGELVFRLSAEVHNATGPDVPLTDAAIEAVQRYLAKAAALRQSSQDTAATAAKRRTNEPADGPWTQTLLTRR